MTSKKSAKDWAEKPTKQRMIRFGEDVRRQRQAFGLSLRQLAKEAHMTPAYLSLIERGLNVPSPEKFAALCWVLGTPELHREANRRTYKELFRMLDSIQRLQGHLPFTGKSPPRLRAKLFNYFLQCATNALTSAYVEDGSIRDDELSELGVRWSFEFVAKGEKQSRPAAMKAIYRMPIDIACREPQPL